VKEEGASGVRLYRGEVLTRNPSLEMSGRGISRTTLDYERSKGRKIELYFSQKKKKERSVSGEKIKSSISPGEGGKHDFPLSYKGKTSARATGKERRRKNSNGSPRILCP